MSRTVLLVWCIVSVNAGCTASTSLRTPEDGRASRSLAARQQNLVTAVELRKSGGLTLYDALLRARPEMLGRRSMIAVGDPRDGRPVVYFDGMQQGDIDMLHRIPAEVVLDVRYLSPSAGTARFGHRFAGGIIEVRSAREMHAVTP